jgi:hypothetical protein
MGSLLESSESPRWLYYEYDIKDNCKDCLLEPGANGAFRLTVLPCVAEGSAEAECNLLILRYGCFLATLLAPHSCESKECFVLNF